MTFDELKCRRSDAQGQAASLQAALVRLHASTAAVDIAQANLEDHDRDASEAMQAWALSGGKGEHPVADHSVRSELMRAVAHATAAAGQAGAASDTLHLQLREANAEVERINAKLLDLAVAQARQEQGELVRSVERLTLEELRPRLAKIRSLRSHLLGRARQHQSSGRDEAARILFGLATGLPEVATEADPSPAEIHVAETEWAQRLGELMGAAPEHVAPPLSHEARLAAARAHGDASAAAHRRAMEGNRPAGNVVAA